MARRLPKAVREAMANAGGRAEGASCQVIVAMVDTDYIEIWVKNDTSTTAVTVSELNVIVEALN